MSLRFGAYMKLGCWCVLGKETNLYQILDMLSIRSL